MISLIFYKVSVTFVPALICYDEVMEGVKVSLCVKVKISGLQDICCVNGLFRVNREQH